MQSKTARNLAALSFEFSEPGLLTDAERRIVGINRAFSELYGHSEAALLKRDIATLYAAPESSTLWEERHFTVDRFPAQRVIELQIRHCAGAAIASRMTVNPLTGSDGAHSGFAIRFEALERCRNRMLTLEREVEQLEAELATQRKVNRAMPANMIVFGADGRIRKASDRLLSLTGHALSELVGNPLSLLIPAPLPARAEMRDADEATILLRAKNGAELEMTVEMQPLEDARGNLTILLLHPARREENAARNAALSGFAQRVAHDLKAPARNVAFLSEVVQDALEEGDIETARQYSSDIFTLGREMVALINSLLTLATNPKGVSIGENDLTRIAESAVKCLKLEIEERGAEIEIGELAVLPCDAVLVKTVFQNLISNALKYVAEGTAPRVTVSGEVSGTSYVISIADNGIGIPADARARIFEPLERLHQSEDKVGGFGLGLAICRRVLAAHDGDIWVEPGETGGSRFRMSLPISRAEPAPTPDILPEAVPATAPKAASA